MIKTKYNIWDKVILLSWNKFWVNYICFYKDYYTYNLWDWNTAFLNVDEWQIKWLEEGSSIWFTVQLWNSTEHSLGHGHDQN